VPHRYLLLPSGDPIAAVASIILLLDMALFGWLVFKRLSTMPEGLAFRA
jgi:hypothetical protein